MANIGMLLPRKTVLDCANKVIAEDHRQVLFTKLIQNSNAVSEAEQAVKNGAQILIARGFQARLIKKHVQVPVVEIALTVQEIGLLVKKVKHQLGKKHPVIAVVYWENMFHSMDHLEELFDFTLRTYFLNELDEVSEKVSCAIADGADAIIGGIDANRIALEQEFPAFFADTSEDSIRIALKEAENIGRVADMERDNNAQLAAIFDTSYNGIIRINSAREVVAVNHMIEEAIGKKISDIAGMTLEQVMPDIDKESIERILSGEQEVFSWSVTIGKQVMFVTGTPIWFEDRVGGAILICKKIQNTTQTDRRLKNSGNHGGWEQTEKKFPGLYIPHGNFSQMQRGGREISDCLELARSYACSSNPILICGETGTEKELLAEAIHNNSPQRGHPFYRINCSSCSPEKQKKLFEGIYNERKMEWDMPGILQLNTEGTIYLQNLENLSLECQYLLVEAVTRHMYWNGTTMVMLKRCGRILVDMSDKPERFLAENKICPELYYLFSLKLELPPLWKTRKLIPDLAKKYFQKYLGQYSQFMEIEPEGYQVMQQYHWPGNLMQLEHFCEYLVLTARRRKIRAGYVQEQLEYLYSQTEGDRVKIQNGSGYSFVGGSQAQEIVQALVQTKGNRVEAAKLLGISPTTLWRRMNKFGIMKQ